MMMMMMMMMMKKKKKKKKKKKSWYHLHIFVNASCSTFCRLLNRMQGVGS